MVITQLQEGLGNQLFQYATGRSVAQRTGKRLFLDSSFYRHARHRTLDLNAFNYKAGILWDGIANMFNGSPSSSKWKQPVKNLLAAKLVRLTDARRGYDPRIETLPGHCRLSGYWQSERYFSAIRSDLLKELTLKDSSMPSHAQWVSRINAPSAVAIHVRRGDLVQNQHYRQSVGTLTPSYYQAAIDQIVADIPDAEFFVFTEDTDWARKHIRSTRPVNVVSTAGNTSAAQELALMSMCRHFIIANSTFSWWGAWLSNSPAKIVIAPARFFRVQKPQEVDLLPVSWRKIETELSDSA